jgi:hypothetical protein
MASPANPPAAKPAKGAKSGVKPGSVQAAPQKGGKRPAKEEDVFGGAERTHNPDVKSPNAKP